MTLIRIVESIYEQLCWCPNATVQRTGLHLPAQDTPAADTGPWQDAGIPARAGWLKRYRNRVLLWAVLYTLFFIPFVGAFDALGLMKDVFTGILAGLVISAFFARRLLRSFDTAIAAEKEQTAGLEGYAILFMVIGMILAAVALIIMALFSIIPEGVAMELPAFATGVALIPWYVLVLVFLWERKTGCMLFFEKKTLSFTASRCS